MLRRIVAAKVSEHNCLGMHSINDISLGDRVTHQKEVIELRIVKHPRAFLSYAFQIQQCCCYLPNNMRVLPKARRERWQQLS